MTKPKKIKPAGSTRYRRFMIYGDPGGGKSTLAASALELGKVLFVNADRPDGLDAARSMPWWNEKKIEEWKLFAAKRPYDDIEEVVQYLRHEGHEEFPFVVLDSHTMAEEMGMDQIMVDLHQKKEHRSIYKPDKAEYGENQQRMSAFYRRMKGVPVNLIVTAHVMSIVDEEDGEVTYMPSIQGGRGKMSQKVCGHMGVVGRLYTRTATVKTKGGDKKKTRRRVLQVQPSKKFYAKDGTNKLGDEVVSPTMADIFATIGTRKGK